MRRFSVRILVAAFAATIIAAAAVSDDQRPKQVGTPPQWPRVPQPDKIVTDPPLVAPLALPHDSAVAAVAYSPDARLIASTTMAGWLHLWDLQSGKLLWQKEVARNFFVTCVAFSPDGKTIACGAWESGPIVSLVEVSTGKQIAALRQTERGRVVTVAFSPEGRWMASGGAGLIIWDAKTRKQRFRLLEPEIGRAQAVAFSPDGKMLASASNADRALPASDSTLRLWDTGTGKELRTLGDREDGWVQDLKFSPSGKFLACASTCYTPAQDHIEFCLTRLCDVKTGGTVLKITDSSSAVAFSPDGDLFVVTGTGHSSCRMFETATCKEVQTLARRMHYVRSVAVSPDERSIAMGSSHHTVVVQRLIPMHGVDAGPLSPDYLKELWIDLGSSDAKVRYQAIWMLAAKPTEAVPFLTKRLLHQTPLPDLETTNSAMKVLTLVDTLEAGKTLQTLIQKATDQRIKQSATDALRRRDARKRITSVNIEKSKSENKRQ